MVFSFFKKDPKDAKARTARAGNGRAAPSRQAAHVETKSLARPLAGPVNRSLNRSSSMPTTSFATTENALPDRELHRSLALATAAKIDAIESEMARDFLRPRSAANGAEPAANSELGAARTPAPAPAAAPVAAVAPAPVPEPVGDISEDAFDPGSEVLAGSVDAIELGGPDASSVLDETAILFANRQDDAAEAGLRAALTADCLGAATEKAWLMLFEFLQQRGDKAGFEQLTMQYALRFENSAPGWIDYETVAGPDSRSDPRTEGPAVRLPDSINAGIVKPLEQLKALAMTHATLTLDVSAARSIDPVGAELLLRVFAAFKRASHELIVLGTEQLLIPLRAAIEPGRRDASDAAWMLLLEVQRLLNRQADFEETGIQYCITYEVSPPSWEPAPSNIRTGPGAGVPSQGRIDPLDWRGEIAGDGEAFFGRLAVAGRAGPRLAVECRHLRRMAFSAATALLGQVVKLQQSGITIEFRNVNVLVGSLLQLLGVAAVADVHLRRN